MDSVAGAMIKASSNLLPSARRSVVMDVTVDGGPMQLVLDAVCHVNKGTHEDAHFIGMAFQNLTREELALFT